MGSLLELAETKSPLCMCIRSISDTYTYHTPRYNSDRKGKYTHTTSKCFQLIKPLRRKVIRVEVPTSSGQIKRSLNAKTAQPLYLLSSP